MFGGLAFVSLGTKTALALSLVLAASGVATAFELSNQTRERLVEGKVTAAGMVVDLFAASVAPALDFGDDEALSQEFAKLAQNKDVTYAAVFRPGRALPVAEIGNEHLRPAAAPSVASARTHHDDIEVARVLESAETGTVGSLFVRVSLAAENERFLAARRRIVEFTGLLTLLAGAIVIVISRRVITRPLRDLARAARRLETGSAEQVAVGADDEIGQLAGAFNAMSRAIVDRERRLAELNRELMQLLDSMRQAILVFEAGGALSAVKSHQAEVIFGDRNVEGLRVQDLLFPGDAHGVGRAAFEEWLTVAFSVPADRWAELAELAPVETIIGSEDSERVLSLDFRPIEVDGRVGRIMVLASDETEKRALERTVRERDEEHERQMAAMRRLVAGGGQLLVSILARARDRLVACADLVAEAEGMLETSLVEQLFAHAHSVKGEARAFDLSLLESRTAELEDFLAIQRGRIRAGEAPRVTDVRTDLARRIEATLTAVGGASDMLVQASPIGAAILEQVTVQRGDVERLLKLTSTRSDEITALVNRLASRPFGEMLLGLSEAVPRWAARESKRARMEVEGKEVAIPPRLADVLPDVLTHLLRNALAHGIETIPERALAGKDEIGLIRITAVEGPAGPSISVEDDGRGLDEIALRKKAADAGSKEADPTVIAFSQGLSTATPGTLAGHGVGLDAVRSDLARVGYTVTLHRASPGLRVVLSPEVSAPAKATAVRSTGAAQT